MDDHRTEENDPKGKNPTYLHLPNPPPYPHPNGPLSPPLHPIPTTPTNTTSSYTLLVAENKPPPPSSSPFLLTKTGKKRRMSFAIVGDWGSGFER